MSSSIIRKGKDALSSPASGKFLKISNDDAVVIAPLAGLEEMISIDQHEFWEVNPAAIVPCIHRKCPACEAGNSPRFKGFLPVVTKEGEVKVWAFGIKVERNLEDLESELGTLKGQALKFRRTGTGKMTQYIVTPLGRKMNVADKEMPDIESMIGPLDAEGITRVLVDRGVISDSGSGSKVATSSEEEEFTTEHDSDSEDYDTL
jgi:hypothetical protein